MSTRGEVLARIRAALPVRTEVSVPQDYRRAGEEPVRTDLTTIFTERVGDYRAEVVQVTAAALPGALGAVLDKHQARRVVIPADLPEQLCAAIGDRAVVDAPPLSIRELDALDGAVTTCAVAVAETGTIVLDTGPGQGRRAISLVPDLHVVIVRAEQVVRGVPEAVAALDPARPLTWISGPSATSDIELQRVEGVHGPRRLVVLLVDDQGAG